MKLANNLISHNFLRRSGKKPAMPATKRTVKGGAVRLLGPYDTFAAEAEAIAQDIESRFGDQPDSVVVLGRRRRLLGDVNVVFRERGVRASLTQRKDEFQSPPVVWMHSLFRLANDRQSTTALDAVAGSFGQLTGIQTDPEQVAAEAKAGNGDYLRQWVKVAKKEADGAPPATIIDEVSASLAESVDLRRFNEVVTKWVDTIAAVAPERGEENGEPFADAAEEIEVWKAITGEIGRAYRGNLTLEAFLQEIQMRSKEAVPRPHSVELMTIHSAKGKEFHHVYLIGMVDDEIPSFQSLKRGDRSLELEEERRNCFVAVTRTIDSLTLSFARIYQGWPKRPSRFLREMGLIS